MVGEACHERGGTWRAGKEAIFFAEICRLSFEGDAEGAAKMQDEANRVVTLMVESENWSYRKAMMKYIGLDCGWCRYPFATLSDAEYADYARRIEALGILRHLV